MASGIKFDLSTFRAGLRAKLAVTKKAEADVLNQAGGSVCANTIRLTKKANRAKIQSELQINGLAFRILQSPHAQRCLPANLRGYTRGTHTRQQINAAAVGLYFCRVQLSSIVFTSAPPRISYQS